MSLPTDPFYVVGPTGSGKSEVALRLAERWGGEIVNADAFQLYSGMPIITAAPSEEDRRRHPHHLYGVLSPCAENSVAAYADLAERAMRKIQARGHRPIVVGGSGLYVKALTHGLADLPAPDETLRAALETLEESERVAWLEKLDPKGARSMNLRNPRYVGRALAMSLIAGIPASVLKSSWRREDEAAGMDGICIQWERQTLYRRIGERVEAMVKAGALEEVAALPADLSRTASRAIGVQELRCHLAGECTLEAAVEAIQQATRRFAKRQETWFRREGVFRRVTHGDAMAWS